MAVCTRSNDTPSSQTSAAVIAVRIAAVPLSGSAVPLPCQSGLNKQKLRRSATQLASCLVSGPNGAYPSHRQTFCFFSSILPTSSDLHNSAFGFHLQILVMSYRGRPSKGCESCRARKVRVSQAVAVTPHFGQPSCSSMLLYRLDRHTLLQPSQSSRAKWG
jgi:hypothetical protein